MKDGTTEISSNKTRRNCCTNAFFVLPLYLCVLLPCIPGMNLTHEGAAVLSDRDKGIACACRELGINERKCAVHIHANFYLAGFCARRWRASYPPLFLPPSFHPMPYFPFSLFPLIPLSLLSFCLLSLYPFFPVSLLLSCPITLSPSFLRSFFSYCPTALFLHPFWQVFSSGPRKILEDHSWSS